MSHPEDVRTLSLHNQEVSHQLKRKDNYPLPGVGVRRWWVVVVVGGGSTYNQRLWTLIMYITVNHVYICYICSNVFIDGSSG